MKIRLNTPSDLYKDAAEVCLLAPHMDLTTLLRHIYIGQLVESGTQVRSPHSLQDIDIIESVQRRYTKRLPGLFNYAYTARLELLKFECLEERRIANSLLFWFKMIHERVG